MENSYIETIIDRCVKGIKSGLESKDYKKMWRGYFGLKNALLTFQADKDQFDPDDEVDIIR